MYSPSRSLHCSIRNFHCPKTGSIFELTLPRNKKNLHEEKLGQESGWYYTGILCLDLNVMTDRAWPAETYLGKKFMSISQIILFRLSHEHFWSILCLQFNLGAHNQLAIFCRSVLDTSSTSIWIYLQDRR